MHQYLHLLQKVREKGKRQKNRTGVDTFFLPGHMLNFDLAEGFPILTTKFINFRSIVAELLGFIKGFNNAGQFRDLGTRIWDKDANENPEWLKNPNRAGKDDLGRIYGKQWRDWRDPRNASIDQLALALHNIVTNHTSRRIIVTAWNPGELHTMALPPCHLLFQVLVGQEEKKLHMTMYQRSCDLFLGVPFNISSYALLLSLIAHVTGYDVGTLSIALADVHIYENHLEQVDEQLTRVPHSSPQIQINENGTYLTPLMRLESILPHQIHIHGYLHYPEIKAELNVGQPEGERKA